MPPKPIMISGEDLHQVMKDIVNLYDLIQKVPTGDTISVDFTATNRKVHLIVVSEDQLKKFQEEGKL